MFLHISVKHQALPPHQILESQQYRNMHYRNMQKFNAEDDDDDGDGDGDDDDG